jgi:hypothetical protein
MSAFPIKRLSVRIAIRCPLPDSRGHRRRASGQDFDNGLAIAATKAKAAGFGGKIAANGLFRTAHSDRAHLDRV